MDSGSEDDSDDMPLPKSGKGAHIKKPLSAYNFYLRAANTGTTKNKATIGEVSSQWSKLDTAMRDVYYRRAAIDKQRYIRETLMAHEDIHEDAEFAYPSLSQACPSVIGCFAHAIPQRMVQFARATEDTKAEEHKGMKTPARARQGKLKAGPLSAAKALHPQAHAMAAFSTPAHGSLFMQQQLQQQAASPMAQETAPQTTGFNAERSRAIMCSGPVPELPAPSLKPKYTGPSTPLPELAVKKRKTSLNAYVWYASSGSYTTTPTSHALTLSRARSFSLTHTRAHTHMHARIPAYAQPPSHPATCTLSAPRAEPG